VGVRIVDTSGNQGKDRAVRYVSDVLNLNGRLALDAPAWVARDRCVP
jgi:hypothetical protein